jgi:hypothetical protein
LLYPVHYEHPFSDFLPNLALKSAALFQCAANVCKYFQNKA